MNTLLVGRGLLGSHLEHRLSWLGTHVVPVSVPWPDPAASERVLLDAAIALAGREPRWRLAWCAGAGFTSTSADVLAAEVELYSRVLRGLDEAGAAPSALVLASSAGGVYSGSADPAPYDEWSAVGAASAYGEAKLAMEEASRELAGATGTRVLLARISNLYGPGQDLGKPQGLVSQLCLSQVFNRPLGIYVALDTLRDYVFAPDAAAVLAAGLDRVSDEPTGTVVTKIVASGRATSIAELAWVSTRVFRTRPWLQLRANPASAGQVRDLRLRSRVWTDLDALSATPLPTGLRATADDVGARHRAGLLSRHVVA